MRAQAEPDSDGNAPDVIITEIGGTVGDIESQPFLEAARQVRADIGRANVAFVHVSLIPFLPAAGELKTKPTQHSVAALRNIGIQPDALVLRTDRPLPEGIKGKVALMCDVEREAVIECKDAASIYEVPPTLHREGLDAFLVQRLGLTFRDVDWREWNALLERVHSPKYRVEVALVATPTCPSLKLLSTAVLPTTPMWISAGWPLTSAKPLTVRSWPWPGWTPLWYPAVLGCAALKASWGHCDGPVNTACPPWVSAWAYSAW